MRKKKNNAVTIIFPHQLFKDHPALLPGRKVVMVEEWLYFNQYRFIKQKLVMHRASMQFYKQYLNTNYDVEYIEATSPLSDIRKLIESLANDGISELHFAEVSDDWLDRRIAQSASTHSIEVIKYPGPDFLIAYIKVSNLINFKLVSTSK